MARYNNVNIDFYIDYIRGRLWKYDLNYLLSVIGAPGTGKSNASIWLAEQIDDDFGIHKIFYEPIDFVNYVRNDAEKGDCVIFEEVGVSAFSRNFYDIINKSLVYIMETVRYKNFCCIMNLPSLLMLDSAIRNLFHGTLETKIIDFDENECICTLYKVDYDPTGRRKPHYKFIRVENPDTGRRVKIRDVLIPKVDDVLWGEYMGKKIKFGDNLYERIHRDVTRANEYDAMEWGKAKPIEDMVIEVKKNLDKFQKVIPNTKKIIIDWKRIANEFKVGEPTAKRVKTAVEG